MCGEGGGSHREWCVWGGGEGVTVSGVCGEGGGGSHREWCVWGDGEGVTEQYEL